MVFAKPQRFIKKPYLFKYRSPECTCTQMHMENSGPVSEEFRPYVVRQITNVLRFTGHNKCIRIVRKHTEMALHTISRPIINPSFRA
jgi:hypothetical protein